MKRVLHLWIISLTFFCFFSQLHCMFKQFLIKDFSENNSTKQEKDTTKNCYENYKTPLKKCFKAIEKKDLKKVKELIENGLNVNSVLDLNKDDYYEYQTVVGSSKCSLLEWARYQAVLEIYRFLSNNKDITFDSAGFLLLEAGSSLPLNEDGSLNSDGKNAYPINNKKWPAFKPISIDVNKEYYDLYRGIWIKKN